MFGLQSDLIHQSVYELVHTDDRAEFQKQLHLAHNPSFTPDTGQLVQGKQQMYISQDRSLQIWPQKIDNGSDLQLYHRSTAHFYKV